MIIKEELAVCSDCIQYIVNDDVTGQSLYKTEDQIDEWFEAVNKTLESFGGYAVAGDESFGFMNCGCDCCRDGLAGDKFQVLILEAE
tara:strand:+ start:912 stop:1172 length:261 start_codon:yes stop_codon:yes gene_type:complete